VYVTEEKSEKKTALKRNGKVSSPGFYFSLVSLGRDLGERGDRSLVGDPLYEGTLRTVGSVFGELAVLKGARHVVED